MSILITGDVSTWNIKNFSVDKINIEFAALINSSESVIYNLEGPIGDHKSQPKIFQFRTSFFKNIFYNLLVFFTGKKQPIVFSELEILNLLKQNQKTIVTLANNHIKDLGRNALGKTLEILSHNKIQYSGAGMDQKEANKTVDINSETVLINVNYVASKKWGIPFLLYNALENDFGSAYLEYQNLQKKINKLKKSKKVILIIHGGKEFPKDDLEIGIDLEKVKLLGADVTVIHHPHVYIKTSYEKDNIFILGDFIFHRPEFDPKRESALLEVDFKRENWVHLKYFEVSQVYDYMV